jgi:DNA-binding cell septation regulator SpoVG
VKMEITSVTIQTATANGDFRAYACLRVIGLRLFHMQNGYELFMPSKKLSSGQRVILAESKTDEMKNRI